MVFSKFFDPLGRGHPDADRTRSPAAPDGRRYNPHQPRVPAGRSDGGQWTRGAHGPAPPFADDPRVLSDATPDNEWIPGSRHASRRGGRGGLPPETFGQSLRLERAMQRLQAAEKELKMRDPLWRRPEGAYSTTEGRIAHFEAAARQAERDLAERIQHGMGPGPFAVEWQPARGPGRSFRVYERRENDRIGYRFGCHTCGERDPKTESGHFYLDHQSSNAVNRILQLSQILLPHCKRCSDLQGIYLMNRWRKK